MLRFLNYSRQRIETRNYIEKFKKKLIIINESFSSWAKFTDSTLLSYRLDKEWTIIIQIE